MTVGFYEVAAFFKRSSKFDSEALALFQTINFNNTPPPYDLFHHALAGYSRLKNQNLLFPKEIITLIDFRRSANDKRLWVIDLKNKALLFHVLTAHGATAVMSLPLVFPILPTRTKVVRVFL
jgi:hypothetical protein